jgi:hypothetical protein
VLLAAGQARLLVVDLDVDDGSAAVDVDVEEELEPVVALRHLPFC